MTGRQKPGFQKMGNRLDSEQNKSEDQLSAELMKNEGKCKLMQAIPSANNLLKIANNISMHI